MNKIKTIYNIVMKKTKKYNRWKKNKDIKRRYTKKQNYYGGVMPSLGNIASVGDTLNDLGNNGYGNTGYQPSNNNADDNVYHPHDSPTLNYVGNTLNDVNSKVSALNSGISTFNEKIDQTKDDVAKGIGKMTTGAYNVAKNVMSGLAESVDIDQVKQGSVAAGILIDAAKIPILESEKVLTDLVDNAVANAGVSAVKIGTDVLTAIPGVGAAMELPKLANDITNMVSQGVGLGTELLNISGHIVDETKKSVDQSLDTLHKLNIENAVNQAGQNAIKPLLSSTAAATSAARAAVTGATEAATGAVTGATEAATGAVTGAVTGATGAVTGAVTGAKEATTAAATSATMQKGGLKKLANEGLQIGGRINDSLAEFADPIGYQSGILKGGHNKTKRAMVNGNDRKSRRVRFSM